jgi:hypothetical protein
MMLLDGELCMANSPCRAQRGRFRKRRRLEVPRALAAAAVAAFLAAPVAAAPAACPDGEIGRLLPTGTGLRVLASNASELRPGDVIVQLNSHPLRICADLNRALKEARARDLALLLLVRREQETVAVVAAPAREMAQVADTAPPVGAAVSNPPAEAEPEIVSPRRAATPTVAAPTATARVEPTATARVEPTAEALALRGSDVQPVRVLLGELVAFGRALRSSLPVPAAQPWVGRIADLRRSYERRRAAAPAVRVAEPIVADYETVAEILAYQEELARQAGRTRRHPGAEVEFSSGSQVDAWLRRYPALQASVVQAPEKVDLLLTVERSGRWRPDRAVEILVQQALDDSEALSRRLDAAGE